MRRITPEKVTELAHNQVFVFGANEAGRPEAGAAKFANQKFGAEYGVGVGRTGQSYALPTKDHSIKTLILSEINNYVQRFLDHAAVYSDNEFLVTEIGCGLAGYKPEDIAPMFADAALLTNIYLPKRFWDVLEEGVCNE